ncbi:MAG: GIY-YIG nuclease family protein, partial [bacterium]|nr:GIY-YIG nuclease family protein [bacterium]
TNNLERRLNEHNQGINPKCYTYNRRPVKLMYFDEFNNPNDAIDAEKQIKGWSRKKKEALFKRDWERIHELAKCRNVTSHLYYHRPSLDSARDDGKNSARDDGKNADQNDETDAVRDDGIDCD